MSLFYFDIPPDIALELHHAFEAIILCFALSSFPEELHREAFIPTI